MIRLHRVSDLDMSRFEREALALARLDHPNIVPVRDFGVRGDHAFLVVDLVRGRTLADELAAARRAGSAGLPLPDVLDIADQVLDGLAAAHRAGFVHPHLDPGSIVRAEVWRTVKITGLGPAASPGPSPAVAAGTWAYAAPERFSGGGVDGRTDLYALGCVLHELLTGTSPFRVADPAAWAGAHHYQPPARAGDAVAGVPGEVDDLIAHLLAKSRDDRPRDAETARRTVIGLRTGAATDPPGRRSPPAATASPPPLGPRPAAGPAATVLAEPPPPAVTVSRAVPTGTPAAVTPAVTVSRAAPTVTPAAVEATTLRHGSVPVELSPPSRVRHPVRRRLVRACLALAGLAAAIVFATAGRSGPGAPQAGTFTGHTKAVDCVAWSPDSTRIASGSDDTTLRIWDAATGRTVLTLTHSQFPVLSLAWSPDGTRIAAAAGIVDVWDTSTGRLIQRLNSGTGEALAVAWSPDGARIASAGTDGAVHVWNATNGAGIRTFRSDTAAVDALAWSPDARYLAAGSADQSIDIWNPTTGRVVRTLTGHTGTVLSVAWSPSGARIASGGYDDTVRIWNAATGALTRTLPGSAARVWSVAWSPDGTQTVSANAAGTIQIRDAATGRLVRTPAASGATTYSVAWSPDGSRIASGDIGGTVHLWRIPAAHG